MNNKQRIIAFISAIGLILIAIFKFGLFGGPVSQQAGSAGDNEPRVVSTSPTPLEGATIFPTQTITITFNMPLESASELKSSIDPKVDYKVELSEDRKTAKVTPNQPYNLGGGYTFTIKPDTKFDGKKTLGHDEHFGFSTVSYQGV